MRRFLLAAPFAIAAAACVPSTERATPAPPPPDLGRLRAALAPHAALRFDSAAQGRGCPGDATLGEYVQLLVKNGSLGGAAGDVHRLTGGCSDSPPWGKRLPIDPPGDAAYWFCGIDAYTSDPGGESPWHYELHLRARRADGALDLDHLACPGAP